MLNAGVLTFQEFAMHEPLPLATVHEAALDFLRGRDDVVVFGATAVNAYVSEPRMTQHIGVMSTRAADLAEELHQYLSERFHIAVRIREVRGGKGYRLFQIRKAGNRHLVDVRPVDSLPKSQLFEDIRVPAPPQLIALKVMSYCARRGQAKGFSDMRDLALLFLTFPELKRQSGAVSEALLSFGASQEVMNQWTDLVKQEITPTTEEDEFDWDLD